ncbi:L-ascorbate oxidase [Tripterygium wilfordii]|uniref:L-ascorbate oxidase n=1 Tax=Tripterygium wilfordii TaxID=458696 RepID=A0A7J7D8U0_TRIWF|nr:L-ascorbate oxidase [Tripterygium wilfordii]
MSTLLTVQHIDILRLMVEWVLRRKNSYEDRVYGTTCPIPPGKKFTYTMQMKDQNGIFYYYPSLAFLKPAGGFGGIRILSRPLIHVPFPELAGNFTLLIGDWCKPNLLILKAILDGGHRLPSPDGVPINSGGSIASFTFEQDMIQIFANRPYHSGIIEFIWSYLTVLDSVWTKGLRVLKDISVLRT